MTTDLARPQTPPLRVGTTAWRVAAPGETLTHEFHLALPCRPVHVGLIGAVLFNVRIEQEGQETALDNFDGAPPFRESSIEQAESRGIRVDYDLNTTEGLRENLVVLVDFECTLKVKGQVTILLIFETPGQQG
jgi:hypothetical protein